MIYLIEQMKWLLLVGIVVGFCIAWFRYQKTPVSESIRRSQEQRRKNQELKNDLINCEKKLRKEQA